jgi:hypothetical protein
MQGIERLDDDVILTMLHNMSPKDIISFLRALSPAVKDSVMTRLSGSMRRADMALLVKIYKARFGLCNIVNVALHSARSGHTEVCKKSQK